MLHLPELLRAPRTGDPVLILGHRGARGVRPENTLAAFRYAREIKAHGVELDVRLCRSGEVVVFHDDELDQLTDGSGPVIEKTLAELKRLRVREPKPKGAPKGFVPSLSDETIPTLEEVIDALGPDLLIDVELKGRDSKPDGLEKKTVETVRRHHAAKRVFYTSFNPVRLIRLRNLSWTLPLGMLFYHDNPRWIRDRWTEPVVQPEALAPFFEDIDAKLMAGARRRDYSVWTWTVNREEDARRAARAGVRSIITDYPAEMLALGLKAGV